MQLKARAVPPGLASDDIFARLLASRQVKPNEGDDSSLEHLLSPDTMLGLGEAARLLATTHGRVTVVADYDCDGATAAALAVRGLQALRPELPVDFIVPDRQVDGYGLSEAIVQKVLEKHGNLQDHILLTVDNGIASIAGIRLAVNHGLKVVVTDHHLPGDSLPEAHAIVNPNQVGCSFPSKGLAGVGVVFYVLIALRAYIRQHSSTTPDVNLLQFCDLVALGTVADLVPLDRNNRLLVEAGLRRIRGGRGIPGIRALLQSAGRPSATLKAADLGFYIGPRINAAGRLKHMAIGIECLITNDDAVARQLADQLEEVNHQRKQRQTEAVDTAIAATPLQPTASVLVAYDPQWHEGIVGLIAGRLKEHHQRPAFAFAPALADGMLKGSGRSVPGLHLRDMIDFVSKQAPEVVSSFGGHAMAAGLSLPGRYLTRFETLIEAAANHFIRAADPTQHPLEPIVWTDGSLVAYADKPQRQLDLALRIDQQVWGQGFSQPLFDDEFDVLRCDLMAEKHLRLEVRYHDAPLHKLKALQFFSTQSPPSKVRMLYHLTVNRWNGKVNVELQVNKLIY